ncbi:MAG: hypothetical protein Q7R71_01040 [bacterium]|nr:hypothetical protein [bacterium]
MKKLVFAALSTAAILLASAPAWAFECTGRQGKAIVLDFDQVSGGLLLNLPLRTISETCVVADGDFYTLKGLELSKTFGSPAALRTIVDHMRAIQRLGLTAEDAGKLYSFAAQKEKEAYSPKEANKVTVGAPKR